MPASSKGADTAPAVLQAIISLALFCNLRCGAATCTIQEPARNQNVERSHVCRNATIKDAITQQQHTRALA